MKSTIKTIAAKLNFHLNNKQEAEIKRHLNNPIFFECGPKRIPAIFIKNIYQQRILLDPADYNICIHYMEHLDWEDHLEIAFSESLSKGGLYIDIGANIGIHVLRAHRLGAKAITAFEPNPNTFQLLKFNTELSGIMCDIVECAASDKTASAKFNAVDVSAGMAHLTEGDSYSTIVKTDTLSNYFNGKPNNASLTLIKIDVEGHEGEVIRGAMNYLRQHKNFNMIIEFNSESAITGVNALAEEFDFEIWCYRWQAEPMEVSMEWVNNASLRKPCDLFLKNLR